MWFCSYTPVPAAVDTKPSIMKSLGWWGVSGWALRKLFPISCFWTQKKEFMAIQRASWLFMSIMDLKNGRKSGKCVLLCIDSWIWASHETFREGFSRYPQTPPSYLYNFQYLLIFPSRALRLQWSDLFALPQLPCRLQVSPHLISGEDLL